MESIVVPKDPSEDLVRLRRAVQDTLTAARSLGIVTDEAFQAFSNTTIESMSADMILAVLELSEQVYKLYSGVMWTEVKKRSAISTAT